jgi:hypothetical protein
MSGACNFSPHDNMAEAAWIPTHGGFPSYSHPQGCTATVYKPRIDLSIPGLTLLPAGTRACSKTLYMRVWVEPEGTPDRIGPIYHSVPNSV